MVPDELLAGAAEILPTRLNPTDATLWDIERDPKLRTTIVAMLLLDRPVAHERLLHVLEAASRLIPRLRQRVVGRPGGIGTPYWDLDDGFDVRRHVEFVAVDGPVTDADVASVAEPLASSPLDRSRPLWECTYVGGPAGRSAVVLKVHHSLTDGVGGMGLLDVMLDRRRDADPRDLDRLPVPRRGRRSSSLAAELEAAAEKMVMLPFELSSAAVSAIGQPVRAAGGVWKGARSAARLLAPTAAPESTLLAGRSMYRHVGTSDIEFERVHAAAARNGCTVNHAFFAGTIAGVAAYHRELGAPIERLRVTMPVSIRRSPSVEAGNQWAPVRFVVPTDIDDPVESMLAMRRLVTASRREPALGFSQSLAGVVQTLPSILSSAVVGGMVRGVDMTLTNVPGLGEPHFLGGAEVERIYAFAPTAGAAMNVGLVSHVGTLCIGTLSDAAAVEHPALLQELIASGLADVVTAAEATAPRPEPRSSSGGAAATAPPAAPAPPERLSALDTSFLRLETPEMPMHIGGVFVVGGDSLRGADGRIRMHDARRHVEARLRLVPRFRRRLAEVPLGVGRPMWVDDDDFAITRHVRSALVPPPGSEQQLYDLCAELFEEPIDRSHPLWEIWIVDGLADGRVGIVEKIHHALIDGISGVELAAAIFDPDPDAEPEVPPGAPVGTAPSGLRLLSSAVVDQLSDPLRLARRTASTLRSPRDLSEQVTQLAGTAFELLRPSAIAPETPFNRAVGRQRELRVVALDLGSIHAAAHAAGATVNDLVLAAIAGAMRDWFVVEGEQPVDVHVLVPVSTRHGGMNDEPGNHVGAVTVALPVGEPDAARRLDVVRSRMARVKSAHEGEETARVLDALDHLPALGDGALARLVASQPLVNFVVTNLPGPRAPLYFLGGRIEQIVPVVPLGPNLGLGIAVLSYVDELRISLFADPDACRDLDVLAAAIGDRVAELLATLDG